MMGINYAHSVHSHGNVIEVLWHHVEMITVHDDIGHSGTRHGE